MFRRSLRRMKRHWVQIASRRRAREIIESTARKPDGPFGRTPPEGYRRGIDYYDREQLIRATANVLASYRASSGEFPDLMEPRTFSEKLTRAKFFAAMKVPETGNKSLTETFIPEHVTAMVRCPEIVWRSRVPVLPGNDEVSPGIYYLKTNHGSGWVRRIEYPLSAIHRASLETDFGGFLLSDYGVEAGEWWYNVFDRELLLERAISESSPSTVLQFFVVAGQVRCVTVNQKALHKGHRSKVLLLDSDFRVGEVQLSEQDMLRDFELAPELRRKTLEVAREIGKQFAAIRVDLMIGDDGCIYLNELTQMSKAGHAMYNPRFDRELGEKWQGQEIYNVTY